MSEYLPRGYDVARYQQDVIREVKRLIDDIALRKWCVEKAIDGIGAEPVGISATTLADDIYRFVTGSLPERDVKEE